MYASWVSDDSDNLYAILGVFEDASADDIKAAYRGLARVYHPDRNPDEEFGSADEFLKIKQAYEVLQDEKSRQVYDSCRHAPEFQFRRNRYSTQVASGMIDELVRR
jgi:DnaJ-class molecular chaperone